MTRADDEQRDVQHEDDEADSSAEQVVGYHDDTADPARHDMTSHKLQAASHKLGVRSLGLAAWGCQAVILSQQANCESDNDIYDCRTVRRLSQ